MTQKRTIMDTKKYNKHTDLDEDLENLGLDADHSSDNFSVNGLYNNDNDIISVNEGEGHDPHVDPDQTENSPLDDK